VLVVLSGFPVAHEQTLAKGNYMKTIIAGSRTADRYDDLLKAIALIDWKPTAIISGTARGADQLGERWAQENGIPLHKMPADWNKHGKSAGYKRNLQMAECADALIALWDGESRGTVHMIRLAREAGLRVFVHRTG
jgi:SLOG family YspA-like protein